MSETIRIFAQVGDHEPQMLGMVDMGDKDGAQILRTTAALLRSCADHFDDMTTMYELNAELDRLLR